MRKFTSRNNNFIMNFGTKEKALEYVKNNPNQIYEEFIEWKYYAPNMNNSTTSYRHFKGNNFINAIEQNFEQIIKDHNFYGASGYTLNDVKLINNHNGIVTLKITGWSFSDALVGYNDSMLSDNKKKTINIDILDVTEDEFSKDIYNFEINRKK